MKCHGKDRNLNPCRLNAQGDTQFCKNHQYMKEYSTEHLNALTICSGCKKAFFHETNKTCECCCSRGKTNRTVQKNKVVPCAHEKCNYKKSKDNKYCKLHQIYLWVDEVHESGHRPCTQFIRGCREIIEENSIHKRCDSCRSKEREKDQDKRDNAKQANAEQAENATTKHCTTCGKEYPLDSFSGSRKQKTMTCNHCRERNKIQDEKRDKEHRLAMSRERETTEEQKNRKKQWKKENWDKVVKAWRNYRIRNPDASKKQHEKQKVNVEYQYKIYVNSAKYRNIGFLLTLDEFKTITANPCSFCGKINETRGFHGVDRNDSSLGYTVENCSASCSMCNYIKCKMTSDVFVKRVQHILSHSNYIECQYNYSDSFSNYTGTPYSSYKRRAEKRSLPFEISEEFFMSITGQPCYLCGKKTSHNHRNGIDRVDNAMGYTETNSKPCCGGCNYMKNAFSLDTWFVHLQAIHHHQISTL